MIAVMLGAPGVGKGTQARLACAGRPGWSHLSTGEFLREEVRRGSALGCQARSYIDRGDLVPDPVMVEMVAARVAGVAREDVLLLDGFPRTLPQATALNERAPGGPIPLALYFSAPADVLVQRLLGRHRADDDREVLEHRLAVFRATTEPLIHFYRRQGSLREIDADRSIEAIQGELVREVQDALDRHLNLS